MWPIIENVLEHNRQRIAGENLPIQALETRLIEILQRTAHLALPLTPVVTADFVVGRRSNAATAGALGQDRADLADRDATLDPGQDAAHGVDIGL